jgi:hypothetical protein
MNRLATLLALTLLTCLFPACDAPQPVAGTSGSSASAPPAPPPPPPGSESPPPPPAGTPPAAAPTSQPRSGPEGFAGIAGTGLLEEVQGTRPPPSTPAPTPQPETELVEAKKGVGLKGRSLDEYEGVIVTPVKAYFAARERAFFEIEFPGNYRLWKAMNDETPKDFEDLKAKFLDPLGLTSKLPVLPPGHKYVWDASKEELMVERPRRKQ